MFDLCTHLWLTRILQDSCIREGQTKASSQALWCEVCMEQSLRLRPKIEGSRSRAFRDLLPIAGIPHCCKADTCRGPDVVQKEVYHKHINVSPSTIRQRLLSRIYGSKFRLQGLYWARGTRPIRGTGSGAGEHPTRSVSHETTPRGPCGL